MLQSLVRDLLNCAQEKVTRTVSLFDPPLATLGIYCTAEVTTGTSIKASAALICLLACSYARLSRLHVGEKLTAFGPLLAPIFLKTKSRIFFRTSLRTLYTVEAGLVFSDRPDGQEDIMLVLIGASDS